MCTKLATITAIALTIYAVAEPNTVSKTEEDSFGILGLLLLVLFISIIFFGFSVLAYLVSLKIRDELGLGPPTAEEITRIFSEWNDDVI